MLAPPPLSYVVGVIPTDLGNIQSTSMLPWLVILEAGQLPVLLACQPLGRLTTSWGLRPNRV